MINGRYVVKPTYTGFKHFCLIFAMAFVKYIDILLVVAFNYLVKFVPIIYSIAKYVE